MIEHFWGTPIEIVNLRPAFNDFEAATKSMIAAIPKIAKYNRTDIWDIPEFFTLRDAIKKEVDRFAFESGVGDGFYFYDGYVNSYNKGMENSPHNHPGVKGLAVYVIDAPEDSGDLLLHDPRGPVDWEDNSELTTRGVIASSRKFMRVPPIPGLLLLCPAYVIHSVETNLSNNPNPRITIGIDLYSKQLVDYLATRTPK